MKQTSKLMLAFLGFTLCFIFAMYSYILMDSFLGFVIVVIGIMACGYFYNYLNEKGDFFND